MIKERSIVLYVLLTVITLGIFGIYWIYAMGKDIKTLNANSEPRNPGLFALLTVITCGIFLIYVCDRYPKCIVEVQEQRQMVVNDISTMTLVLAICGVFVSGILHLVNFGLIQNQVNLLAESESS